MGVRITAGNCLRWSQPWIPHSCPSPHTTFASLFSAERAGRIQAISVRSIASQMRSPFLGTSPTKLSRRRSVQRDFTASMGGVAYDEGDETDDEFTRRHQQLGVELQEDSSNDSSNSSNVKSFPDCTSSASSRSSVWNDVSPSAEPPWLASVEMRANSVDLPLSLRIIKRKKRKWEEGFKDAGESAYCSVKKAFSSMVFIVRELQSYALQMREILLYENLQGILARVQGEMNVSFVWLFQQIFSSTPTLMVYVMLLLANFTVYSIGRNSAVAAVSSNPPVAVEQEFRRTQQRSSRFDASFINSFFVGGSGSGGGKVKSVAGPADDGRSDSSRTAKSLWDRIREEASRMQSSSRDEMLMDAATLQRLVSPGTVELEPEDHSAYSHTELLYLQALSQDPDNVLLLSNFAQFLFLVLRDHDRAEYYFKRAAKVKPVDGEALCRYAAFLWIARKDLEGAEGAYMEAVDADPDNSHYAANYAHFLWNTGAEDTCYPLEGSDAC